MAATRLQRLRREGFSDAFRLAGPAFRRAAPWMLAGVLLAGLLARIHPAIRFAVWGSDSGEYIFLTERLVETGRITFDYEGWGLAYPYFPGMFVLSGAVQATTGIDLMRAVLWTVPVVGSLVGALVGLLAYRVTSDPRVGVLAGAFAAVSSGVVITTSHAMPGTLGHVFLLAVLVLLPDAYKTRGNVVLIALMGAALLVTHHLSMYFAVGILAFVPFYREMTQQRTDVARLRLEIPLAAGFLLAALVWWLGVAAPFREEIVGDALPFPPLVTAVLFLLALAALPALVLLRRARAPWHLPPRYPGFPAQRAYVIGGSAAFLAVLLLLVLVRLPGTNIDLGWPTLLYAIPLVAWLSFLPLGVATVRFHRHGSMILAWLYAVLGSLAFAIATNSRVLFPFRHVDYMLEAMAPLVAIGMLMVYDQAIASRVPSQRAATRTNFTVGLVALLVVTAALSLPPRETLGGFEEGITRSELEGVRCADAHLPEGSTIAADHRVSSLLFGIAKLDATWDYTPVTYHSERGEDALAELANARVPPRSGEARIDYVFLSRPIEEGVTLLQWETSAPMSAAAIAKFDDPEGYFEKIEPCAKNDVRIYRVRWEALPPAV